MFFRLSFKLFIQIVYYKVDFFISLNYLSLDKFIWNALGLLEHYFSDTKIKVFFTHDDYEKDIYNFVQILKHIKHDIRKLNIMNFGKSDQSSMDGGKYSYIECFHYL